MIKGAHGMAKSLDDSHFTKLDPAWIALGYKEGMSPIENGKSSNIRSPPNAFRRCGAMLMKRLLEQVVSICNGKLNILINNVGTNFRKSTTIECMVEEYSTLIATNFESTYHLCQPSHPLLKASIMGSVEFISSVVGLISLFL